jgi:thiol-disulfide isomerase/thioredoxin
VFHRKRFLSKLTFVVSIAAVLGFMYSCSNAQPTPGKEPISKKSEAKISSVEKAPDSSKTELISKKSDHQLVVYYFMTTYRCPSCHYIEVTTRAALNENFSEQLKSGRMVFKMLNVEEPANEHFAKDYKLYTKSVVLSDLVDEKEKRWNNLEKVWQLIGNDQGFKDYIVKEVKAYLGE